MSEKNDPPPSKANHLQRYEKKNTEPNSSALIF